VLGAVLGGYISATASGTLGQVKGVSVPASFCGGFLLFIGARLGGGCTRYMYMRVYLATYRVQTVSVFFLHLQYTFYMCCICCT